MFEKIKTNIAVSWFGKDWRLHPEMHEGAKELLACKDARELAQHLAQKFGLSAEDAAHIVIEAAMPPVSGPDIQLAMTSLEQFQSILLAANGAATAAKLLLEQDALEEFGGVKFQNQIGHAIDMLVEALHDIQIASTMLTD